MKATALPFAFIIWTISANGAETTLINRNLSGDPTDSIIHLAHSHRR